MGEEEVWASTPRKFFALLQCALEYNKAKSGSKKKSTQPPVVQEGFIDKISGW